MFRGKGGSPYVQPCSESFKSYLLVEVESGQSGFEALWARVRRNVFSAA
jgi:hypothetical protein